MKLTAQMDRMMLSGGQVTPGTTLKSVEVDPALSDQKRSGNGNQWQHVHFTLITSSPLIYWRDQSRVAEVHQYHTRVHRVLYL